MVQDFMFYVCLFSLSVSFYPNVTTLRLANDMANPSVVCDVRAPYSGGLTFRDILHHIVDPVTHPPKITKIIQGDHPLRENRTGVGQTGKSRPATA